MRPVILVMMVLALVAAACGSGDSSSLPDLGGDDTVPPTTASGDDSADDPGPEPTDAPADFDISQLEASVVKIASEGTFVDPQVGLQQNAAGVGSGFVISEDGLVVTNNHVVTGAALLRVFVPGSDEPVNARILGVSECSDLAVIQLEGDGYQPLTFRTDEVATGVEVFSAGYPASDAATIADVDYTLTGGIISATNANGETNWASVDGVLEHDARIRGGNSGGPLVDESGQVVAVNYAGIDESDQNFAIDAAQAQAVIATLSTGEDVDSVGINGQAVADPESGISGVWVASVESGSPADNAGIEAGDIVTKLEGLVLGIDGTLSDYCDVLRTQGSDDVLAVEVLRFETGEVLEGQLNGDPIEQSFSFAQEFEDEVADGATTDELDTYTDYVTVTDDTGTISVEVPAEWSDTNGVENPNFGPSIWAAPDLESFNTTWDTPGVKVESARDRAAEDIGASLNEIDFSQVCDNGGRTPYQDPFYIGEAQLWTECGGTGAIYIVVAAVPADGSFMVRVEIQAVEPRDLDAADRVLDTFVAT